MSTSSETLYGEDAGEAVEYPDPCICREPKEEEGTEEVEEVEEEEEKAPVPLVMAPDHPMMERFQRALKQHLERLNKKISEDILELDTDLKMKEKERETAGLDLYNMQQELVRQQTTLEKFDKKLEQLTIERDEIDRRMKTKRTKWKDEVDKLNTAKKNEHELSNELQKLCAMEKQLEKWESDRDADLAVSQRISEKTQADKTRIIEEKRKMDMHMLRLMTEVTKFEAEIKFMDAELSVKWEEKAVIHQTLSDANADLQAMIDEQKKLVSSWNGVIATMSQRDNVFATVAKELAQCQDAFKTLQSEIESYKRSSAEAMRTNEQLSVVYGRILGEKETADANIKQLTEKKNNLECKTAMLAATIDQNEKELESYKQGISWCENTYQEKETEFNKINNERQMIEDKILLLLQEQMTNDKTATHMNRLVREIREKTRKQEYQQIELENRISKKFLEIEELKGIVARNNEVLEERSKFLEGKEQELKFTENEITKCRTAMVQKQGSYAVLLKKIEKLNEKMGISKTGQDPLQVRITELEKQNTETQEKNEKLQGFWLLHQNNNVKLTHQRHEQLKELNLLRKQVTVLEQRTLKTELQIEREDRELALLNRSIALLQRKMETLTVKLIGKTDYKQNLDKMNAITYTNFTQTLQETELELVRLRGEIADLEASLEELADAMLKTQQEMLAWERRIKMAVEAKESIMKEKSSTGEIGQMKTEIHRMEIRFDQLKKAQEKLLSDLELCVVRRDTIMDTAEAKEKRQGSTTSRYMMQKKLDNIRSRIKTLQNDRMNIEKTIHKIQLGQEDLQEHIAKKEEKLKDMAEKTKKIDEKLDDVKLTKQQNLQMLVRRQKKCKMYNQVKVGKHRMLHKTESGIENDLQNERALNADLQAVTELVLEDFPSYRYQIMKILNTITAKPA